MTRRLGLLEGKAPQRKKSVRFGQALPGFLPQQLSQPMRPQQLERMSTGWAQGPDYPWMNAFNPQRQSPRQWLADQRIQFPGQGTYNRPTRMMPDNIQTSQWFPQSMEPQRMSNLINRQFDAAMGSIPMFKVTKVDYKGQK